MDKNTEAVIKCLLKKGPGTMYSLKRLASVTNIGLRELRPILAHLVEKNVIELKENSCCLKGE